MNNNKLTMVVALILCFQSLVLHPADSQQPQTRSWFSSVTIAKGVFGTVSIVSGALGICAHHQVKKYTKYQTPGNPHQGKIVGCKEDATKIRNGLMGISSISAAITYYLHRYC